MERFLEFQDVYCRDYEHEGLNGVSFSLRKGENAVIFGPEGSGHHLVCPLIEGFIKITQGDVIFRDASVSRMNYEENLLHKKDVGYLPRKYGLISNMTVEENIALPLQYHSGFSSREIWEKVGRMISDLGLESCRSLRPVSLNNSQMLKTAYARAMIFDPELVMVEHAFEGQSFIQILPFLSDLKRRASDPDRSYIFSTFGPYMFTDMADRFIMFYEGRAVFDGNREEFINPVNPYLVQYKNLTMEGPMSL